MTRGSITRYWPTDRLDRLGAAVKLGRAKRATITWRRTGPRGAPTYLLYANDAAGQRMGVFADIDELEAWLGVRA